MIHFLSEGIVHPEMKILSVFNLLNIILFQTCTIYFLSLICSTVKDRGVKST